MRRSACQIAQQRLAVAPTLRYLSFNFVLRRFYGSRGAL
jgi:hypothetical protein